MRTSQPSNRASALTVVEVLVTLMLIALAIFFLLRARGGSYRSKAVFCVNNLRQVSIGFDMFADDHDNRFPSSTNTEAEAWTYFQQIGVYLRTPKLLLCPADKERPGNERRLKPTDFTNSINGRPSTQNFAHPIHRNNALSYFFNLGADRTKPEMFLTGDRGLTLSPRPVGKIWTLGTNSTAEWTARIHNQFGYVGQADGSIHSVRNTNLLVYLRDHGDGTNRIVLP